MNKKEYNSLVKEVCALEGKRVQASVGNVRELLKSLKKLSLSSKYSLLKYILGH